MEARDPRWDDMLTVTLSAGQWHGLAMAAANYDHRIAREQGDGGFALDEIKRVLDAAGIGRQQQNEEER